MAESEMEHVTRQPHPRLRPFIEEYTGYRMSGFEPGIHAGLPSGTLTMIVAFDERLDVEGGHTPGQRQTFVGMIGGLHSAPATVFHSGNQHGIQLALTPRGADALFGVPAGKLALLTEQLDDVAPSYANELIDRVSTAQTWRTRWAILDEIFLRVLQVDREMPAELERAWSMLVRSHGAATIAALADHAGWSRRHFTKKFSEHYGLAPKMMARVLRFERAQRMMRLPTRPSLGAIAAACGYADQAHLTRDCVEFAGAPPTIWMADESIPSLQDNSNQLGDT